MAISPSTQLPNASNVQVIIFAYNMTPRLFLNGTELSPSETDVASGSYSYLFVIPTLTSSDSVDTRGRGFLFYIE